MFLLLQFFSSYFVSKHLRYLRSYIVLRLSLNNTLFLSFRLEKCLIEYKIYLITHSVQNLWRIRDTIYKRIPFYLKVAWLPNVRWNLIKRDYRLDYFPREISDYFIVYLQSNERSSPNINDKAATLKNTIKRLL